MSAIAGVVLLDDRLDCTELIQKLTAAMTRRGPDARGHWVSGNVALGHCMLRTTPESVDETQPVTGQDARFHIVFDGRLDNISELRHELASDIELPEGTPDVMFALAAYRRWREESVEHLLGDFAFAIWDAVEARLFCARDPFGVKPFYFTRNRRVFGFASDHEALLRLPSVTAAVNEDRIAALLVESFDAYDSSISWLAEVHKLEPGHWMHVYPDGRSVTHSYWNPTAPPTLVLRDQREYVDAFNEVFLAAVGCRMRSQSAPALMLSGGVDSGSIAAATRDARLSHWPMVQAISMVSNRCELCDESSNIRSMRDSLGMQGPILTLDELDAGTFDTIINRELWASSHPVRNSLPLPLLLYDRANNEGRRVMLDGIEGDLVTYSPVRYMASLIRRLQIGRAWAEARYAQRAHTQRAGQSHRRIFASDLLHALVPLSLVMLRRRLQAASVVRIPAYVSPDLVRRTRLRERLTQQLSENSADTVSDNVALRLRILVSSPGMRVGCEGMALLADRFAIEPRHPWVDVRLANFFLSLPLERRVRQGWTKHLARTWTAERASPSAVWHAGKGHLGWRVMLRAVTGRNCTPTLVSDFQESIGTPYFDPAVVVNMRAGEADSRDMQRQELAYTLTGLAYWLRRLERLGHAGAGWPVP